MKIYKAIKNVLMDATTFMIEVIPMTGFMVIGIGVGCGLASEAMNIPGKLVAAKVLAYGVPMWGCVLGLWLALMIMYWIYKVITDMPNIVEERQKAKTTGTARP